MNHLVIGGGSIGSILLVCTGNQCRSPMAEAILNLLLRDRAPVDLQSAGFVSEGADCPSQVLEVMAPIGIDLSSHRSRLIRESMVLDADLILGMTRQHVIDLSLSLPEAWDRIFTLAGVVSAGEAVGAREPNQPLRSWASTLGVGRARSSLMALPLAEDIPDPMGKPVAAFLRTRDILSGYCRRLADLLAPV